MFDSRLVLQIVLAKLHISFMAMLLHMCEDPTDGKQPDSGVRWAVSSQEEKRLREWLMVSEGGDNPLNTYRAHV